MIKLTRHNDLLNMRAAFLLNDVTSKHGKEVLIALFRSNVAIDRMTRDALAEALEREDGIRLELVRPTGRPASFIDRLDTAHEYQTIAEEVMARIDAGELPKAAKSKVMEQRGIGATKLKKALASYRRSKVRISKARRQEAPNSGV